MKINTDFTKILKRDNEKKWIALTRDRRRVVGANENLIELRKKLGDQKNDVIYMKVLPSDMEFAFSI